MKTRLLKIVLFVFFIVVFTTNNSFSAITFTVTQLNTSASGITTPFTIFDGQLNTVVVGFKVVASGTGTSATISNLFVTTNNANLNNYFPSGTATLYETAGSTYPSTVNHTYSANVSGSNYQFNVNRTYTASTYYYFLVLPKAVFTGNTVPTTFTFGATSAGFFGNSPSVSVSGSGTTYNAYGGMYWYGDNTTTWSSSTNGPWEVANGSGGYQNANRVPTATDVVYIGVAPYSSNGGQNPIITGYSPTIYRLVYGTNLTHTTNLGASVTLTNATDVLTVKDDVTVLASAGASLAGKGTLTIGGDFTNNTGGTFSVNTTATANQNTVTFNTGGNTIANLNTSATVAFGNLNITGGGTATISTGKFSVSPYSILGVSGPTILSINSAASLTLLTGTSAAPLNYAQIASITDGSTIQGNINYQVYFTGGSGFRNYRSMASPVYDNTTTYTSANGTYKYSNLKNSFIVTGSGGTTNGFDESYNHGATLRTYNSATNDYTFITSLTSTTIATGKGFYMFFRGDRTHIAGATTLDPFGSKTNKADGGGSYATPEAVTYTYTGIPNQGSVSTTFGTTDNNYYFIANPYAATLDANAVINSTAYNYLGLFPTNYINTSIWTWKPGATAQYAIYNSVTPSASTNGAKEYIVPGQGFFVQAATNTGFFGIGGSSNILTIDETMKSTGNNLNAVRNLNAIAATKQEPPVLRLQLYKNTTTSDEIGMVFRDSTKAIADGNDAVHFDGNNLTLSSLSADNKYLAIDVRPFTGSKTEVPLYVTAEVDSTYSLQLSYKSDLMKNYKITLYDSLLNTNSIISKNAYSFQIVNAQASTYGKRFKLIIEPEPAGVLFTKFTGKLNESKKVLLNWNSTSDRSNITYQVQRSTDKKIFANIGQPLNSSVNNSDIEYQTIDNNPAIGANYYRLAQTDLFGNIVYSDTVKIGYNPGMLAGHEKNGFLLYPNAVKDVLSIVSDKDYKDKVNMTIYDSQGNLKFTQAYQGINAQLPLQQNVSNLQLGVYIIHLASNGKELVTLKFNKEQN
ncbi:T9SS type A sorting domain-containing protein [Mucilaginibacter sp. BJC16-A38]|uniref:T9SS type A sorting domain-containing protein n=1 Tax=Mucilaginibacter phenanthrenivorans TaxID=1234842 RepID=UPI00215796EC|nr:T9SS type A sorting domain-containing protein [Mucilaginibacter phenanthrenivorans]MCR8557686.1 T9SS type A sorting domain-containing protein [Mucilaginibacter phenanthrenivorans]